MSATPHQELRFPPGPPPAPLSAATARAFSAVRAALPTTPAGRTAMRPITMVVVHCSATPSGVPLAGGKQPAEVVINEWHRNRKPVPFVRAALASQQFNSHLPNIGYHFVIDLDGRIATGRALSEVGAHVQGHNTRSVGICLVGGVEPTAARYTVAQWQSLSELVRELCSELNVPWQAVTVDRPLGVCGHRDLSPDRDGDGQVERGEWLKTCPGFDVASWLRNGPSAAQVIGGNSPEEAA